MTVWAPSISDMRVSIQVGLTSTSPIPYRATQRQKTKPPKNHTPMGNLENPKDLTCLCEDLNGNLFAARQ